MTVISVKLPRSTLARLNAIARERGQPKSAIIREVLETNLTNGKNPPKLSMMDLAGDLAGGLKGGPSDLATNKKHMEGYGR